MYHNDITAEVLYSKRTHVVNVSQLLTLHVFYFRPTACVTPQYVILTQYVIIAARCNTVYARCNNYAKCNNFYARCNKI